MRKDSMSPTPWEGFMKNLLEGERPRDIKGTKTDVKWDGSGLKRD
jgi:hypothetical protein